MKLLKFLMICEKSCILKALYLKIEKSLVVTLLWHTSAQNLEVSKKVSIPKPLQDIIEINEVVRELLPIL